MKIVYNADHGSHAPGFFLVRGRVAASTEQPERADRLLAAVRDDRHVFVEADDFGVAPVAAVHSARYLDFLEHGHAAWSALPGASEEILPNVHYPLQGGSYPEGIVGRAGFHMADTACPIGSGTWRGVLRGSHAACHAARLVAQDEPAAYVLTRPPGHHATREQAGGFCFLNNTAVAAQWLVDHAGARRVAIVDVDVHHGNGTQDIFYTRDDVLHVSLHADPSAFYPFFTGYAHETGSGRGTGFNLNVPLPIGTGDDAYLQALAPCIDRVRAFEPDYLVVALGLDIYQDDPLRAFDITSGGFERIGRALGGLGMRSVLVQEGGYLTDALGENLRRFLDGFESAHGRP